MTLLYILAGILLLVLTVAYVCFRMAFYSRPRKPGKPTRSVLGDDFLAPYREKMAKWMEETANLPCKEFTVRSYDGLTLYGRYYECCPGAPIELMFHGYRGSADRDLCGAAQRCFALGRNALIVHQRACGKSEGRVITFGVMERWDCLAWLDLLCDEFPGNPVILTGISMGASTVLMAAGEQLPENVIGVLADCGYSSARAIIQKVIADMKLPPKLAYPFVKLGARIFGGFRLDECPAVEAVNRAKVPVLLVHGEADDFVPCDMSRENYAACASRKCLVTFPGAGHGLSYLTSPEAYLQALRDFDYYA